MRASSFLSAAAIDETAIASAIFAVDEALPLEPADGAGAQLVARCARKFGIFGPQCFEAYKQFLVLKAVCKDFDAKKLSPPPSVDAAWHEHILDTRGYRAFCLKAFNQVVEHDPNGDVDEARAVRRAATLHNLKLCFKDEYDRDLWTYPEDRSLKRKRAVVKDEPEPQPSTPRGSLNIRIRDQTGEETFYKVKYTTKFDTIFNKYATRKGVAATLLRFLYDGQRVRGDETPGKCGTPPVCMEDGDQIDCMLEQGGC